MSATPYTIRLDDELKQALEYEAQLDERPPAQLAVRAIRDMVKARQAKRAAIEAALQEAEQGRFISSAAMVAWVDSWESGDERPAPEPDVGPSSKQ
jgi:predicted transcriptional regulator